MLLEGARRKAFKIQEKRKPTEAGQWRKERQGHRDLESCAHRAFGGGTRGGV